MAITSDPARRDKALRERGLDFAWAAEVFAAPRVTFLGDRHDYGEDRFVTVGTLRGRMVVVCWIPRGDDRHVFSMGKANAREQQKYGPHLR